MRSNSTVVPKDSSLADDYLFGSLSEVEPMAVDHGELTRARNSIEGGESQSEEDAVKEAGNPRDDGSNHENEDSVEDDETDGDSSSHDSETGSGEMTGESKSEEPNSGGNMKALVMAMANQFICFITLVYDIIHPDYSGREP